jgi:hypothetical protein
VASGSTRFHKGGDWYYPELVEYWLANGCIREADIHYEIIKASSQIPVHV